MNLAPRVARWQSSRKFGLEQLEQRMLLSTVPPTVTDVEVSSSSWSQPFWDYLQVSGMGDEGYSIPTGSVAQSSPLPWSDLDRISITFSEDVEVDASDLSISGVTNTFYVVEDFFYDPVTHVATWTLASPLASSERVMIDLDANGIDPVQDLAGNLLDGEWTDDISTFSSGDGTAGGDFEFSFNVLEADGYVSGRVDYYDYIYIRGLDGLNTTNPAFIASYDLDGSGTIDIADWMEPFDHLWAELPSGTPAGATNDAPTASGFDLEKITDRNADTRISLDAAFEDWENNDSQLTYSISSQSNSGLFDAVSINASTGELVLNAATTGIGRSEIVVRATDSNGLMVEETVSVDVDRDNEAPVISNYTSWLIGGYVWEISGTVSDGDDDVEGLLVNLDGFFSARTVVRSDGTFLYRIIVLPGEGDWEFASVADPHGEESNNPVTYVSV